MRSPIRFALRKRYPWKNQRPRFWHVILRLTSPGITHVSHDILSSAYRPSFWAADPKGTMSYNTEGEFPSVRASFRCSFPSLRAFTFPLLVHPFRQFRSVHRTGLILFSLGLDGSGNSTSTVSHSSSHMAPLSSGVGGSHPVPSEFTTKMNFHCVVLGNMPLGSHIRQQYSVLVLY